MEVYLYLRHHHVDWSNFTTKHIISHNPAPKTWSKLWSVPESPPETQDLSVDSYLPSSWPRSGHNIIILPLCADSRRGPVRRQARLCRYYIIIFGYCYIAIIVSAGKSIIELRHTNPNDHSNHVLNRNALTLYVHDINRGHKHTHTHTHTHVQ